MERLFTLLHDCRALVPQLEVAGTDPEPVRARAERLLYFAQVAALETGLVHTAEHALTELRQARQPLGPMGVEWLKRQERDLTRADRRCRDQEIWALLEMALTTLRKGAS